MEQAIQLGLAHFSEPAGIFLNVGRFHQGLDTYEQRDKGLARDVLDAIFFMPRGEIDIPKIIGSRIDYLHQMLGLQKDEAL